MSRFEIIGDTEKIKKFLDEFIAMVEEEFQRQSSKLPMSIAYKMVYTEENGRIILSDTFKVPKMIRFAFSGAIKKMEENLKSFLKAKGIECDVKYLGD
jgi:hypothetical protein